MLRSRSWVFAVFFVVVAGSAASAESISLWVKAFIPSGGPSVIKPVPNQAGQTMLDGGRVGCFLTDQRSFDQDAAKSARLTSKISFDLSSQGVSNVNQSHDTGVTHKVDCASGSTAGLCTDKAPTGGMTFKNIQFD